jgi:hypothetical protein
MLIHYHCMSTFVPRYKEICKSVYKLNEQYQNSLWTKIRYYIIANVEQTKSNEIIINLTYLKK